MALVDEEESHLQTICYVLQKGVCRWAYSLHLHSEHAHCHLTKGSGAKN